MFMEFLSSTDGERFLVNLDKIKFVEGLRHDHVGEHDKEKILKRGRDHSSLRFADDTTYPVVGSYDEIAGKIKAAAIWQEPVIDCRCQTVSDPDLSSKADELEAEKIKDSPDNLSDRSNEQ